VLKQGEAKDQSLRCYIDGSYWFYGRPYLLKLDSGRVFMRGTNQSNAAYNEHQSNDGQYELFVSEAKNYQSLIIVRPGLPANLEHSNE